MSVVLVFGSFNPVTNAHISMGLAAREKYPGVPIIFVPDSKNYIQENKNIDFEYILTDEERLKLLIDAVTPHHFFVSAVEINKVVNGKTFNTVVSFQSYDPIICIGADNLEHLPTWYRSYDLVRKFRFLVVERTFYELRVPDEFSDYYSHFDFTSCDFPEVSSSQVRSAVKRNNFDFIKPVVPECTYNFLKNKYQKGE